MASSDDLINDSRIEQMKPLQHRVYHSIIKVILIKMLGLNFERREVATIVK